MRKNKHREDIKAEIRKTGETLQGLSIGNGMDASAASISLRKPLPRANKAIAELLGKTLNELWPEWYNENGERIVSSLSSQSIKTGKNCHCQKRSKKSTERKK